MVFRFLPIFLWIRWNGDGKIWIIWWKAVPLPLVCISNWNATNATHIHVEHSTFAISSGFWKYCVHTRYLQSGNNHKSKMKILKVFDLLLYSFFADNKCWIFLFYDASSNQRIKFYSLYIKIFVIWTLLKKEMRSCLDYLSSAYLRLNILLVLPNRRTFYRNNLGNKKTWRKSHTEFSLVYAQKYLLNCFSRCFYRFSSLSGIKIINHLDIFFR